MNRSALILFGVLIGAMAPSVGVSGTVIEFRMVSVTPGVEGGTGAFYFDQDRARWETKGKKSHDVIIYRGGDKPLLWYVDENLWTYSELNKKNIGKMRGRILDRLEQIEAHMRRLPRAERDIFKQNRKQQLAAMRDLTEEDYDKKITYEKVEDDVVVKDWTCKQYEQLHDGEFDELELYVADWSQLGLSPEDVAVVSQIAKTFGHFGAQFTTLAVMWSEKTGGVIDGFPMRLVMYDEGSERMRIDITTIRKEELAPELFELPEGLDKQPFLGLKE